MAKSSVKVIAERPLHLIPQYQPKTLIQYDGGHATWQCEGKCPPPCDDGGSQF